MTKNILDYPLRIALLEPRIPQNTGNIARTCAAFNLKLDLIEPLGFSLEDKYLKRAGLDYWPYVNLSVYKNIDVYMNSLPKTHRIIGTSKKGDINIKNAKFIKGDVLLFGREDMGLASEIKHKCHSIITIPMKCKADSNGEGGVRSLNLSVAAALIGFEAMRQLDMW